MKTITYVRFADLGPVKTAIVQKDPLSIMLSAAPPTNIVVPTRPICNPKPVVICKNNSISDIKYAVFADLGLSESPVAKNDPLSVIRRAPQVVNTMPTNHSLATSKLPAERTKKPHKSVMSITCARFEELGMLKPVADNEPFYWMKHLPTATSEADKLQATSHPSVSAFSSGAPVLQITQDVDNFRHDVKVSRQRLFEALLTAVESDSDDSSFNGRSPTNTDDHS